MPKINLSNGRPVPTMTSNELDKLLKSDDASPLANTSPLVNASPLVPKVREGKFDKYNKEFPEEIKLHCRKGTKSLLQERYRELGFSSVSTLIRSAIAFALSSNEFRKGWNDTVNK